MMSNRDIAPLERMIKILEPYKNKKSILYVLNKWNRFKITKDFIDWFQTKYPDLKTAILSDTTAFSQAGAFGISIFEHQKTNKACHQISAIYGIIKFELNLREGHNA